jgi:hypothetical protein
LEKNVPSVTSTEALHAGGEAEAVRALVPPGSPELVQVLKAYARGINGVFFMLTGLAALGFVAAWGLGWKSVKTKGKKEDAEEKAGAEV